MFEEAAAVKAKKYAAMSARRQEPLYVAAATHLGHLSRPLSELIRSACVKGRLDPVDALATVSAKVALASAAILRSAEERRHMVHRPASVVPPSLVLYATDAPPTDAPANERAARSDAAAAPATPPPSVAIFSRVAAERTPPPHAPFDPSTPAWLATPKPPQSSVALQTPSHTISLSDAARGEVTEAERGVSTN
jgi:hypothetical protein